MGAGAGLWVVLHAEGVGTVDRQALQRAVVEADVGLGGARNRTGHHREVVVLAGDLDPPGGRAAHGDVAAVVTEAHLERASAQRQRQQLVAQADAEDGHGAHQPAKRLDGGHGQFGVAGAVAHEHAVGFESEHIGCRGARGHHGHGGELAEAAQDGGLDAEVVGHHPASPGACGVGLGHRHLRHQVHPAGAGLGAGRGQKGRLAGGSERARHGAGVADVAGQPPRVDPGDGGHTVASQEAVEAAAGPPVAVAAGEVAHDHAPAMGTGRLRVGAVDAVVADVGIGEGDDLARIRRVRDHLLVPAHHRVEDHLPGGDRGVRADGGALEHLPVAQHQQCGLSLGGRGIAALGRACDGHRWAWPSTTTASPASTVWRTRPRSSRPS